VSVRARVCALLLGINLCAAVVSVPARAQGNQQHVVSQEELSNDSARPGETRHANEAALRHLLSSEAGQQALKSANVGYQRVDKAISQLSDQDLATLAHHSRQVENDFAAGFISPKHLAYIILATVVIVAIIVIV
jgi:hypothetical protein